MKCTLTLVITWSLLLAACGGTSPGAAPADGNATPDASSCNPCELGTADCIGDKVRSCVDVGTGCTEWSSAEACPTDKPFCSAGTCARVCTDECAAGERRCTSGGFQVCGNHDSDSCRDWSLVVSCGADELCNPTTQQCVESCGGAICACQNGETKACVNVGECANGIRTCTGGSFGACSWQQGPSAEECDGLDNDCNGTIDDPASLAAPSCALQLGVCAGSVQTCGGLVGWRACTGGVYLAHATSHGDTYQVTEAACDGDDNDCDGAVDEPAQCCVPSCSGALCGQSDGCGGTCDSGTCGANQSCDQGSCECAFVTCGGTCCGGGQLCSNNACVAGPTPTWTTTTPITTKQLNGIWGSAANNIWAVGRDGIILHYNGATWSSVVSPTTQHLFDVWGSSASNVWAIGSTGMVHFDGTQWSVVAGAAVHKGTNLWGTSASNIYALDHSTPEWGRTVRRFDGSQWTTVLSLSSVEDLSAVHGASPTAVFATGYGLPRHYDGMTWTAWGTTTHEMFSIWAASPTLVWGVGETASISTTVLFRYNGTAWQEIASPIATSLTTIWGRSSTDIWAAGVGSSGRYGIIHFDGIGWQFVGPTMPVARDVTDIWGASASDVWFVGSSGLLLHYGP